MIETIASVATGVGVMFAAAGIWMHQRSLQLQFEQSYTNRYHHLADQMPLTFLKRQGIDMSYEAARTMMLYLELCEDELYYRRVGRISSRTWTDWWIGIRSYAGQTDASGLVREHHKQFPLLAAALSMPDNASYDPCERWLSRKLSSRYAKRTRYERSTTVVHG